MITQLRRKLKSKTARSVILWIILLTLSLGLVLTLVMSLFKLDTPAKGAMTANGQEISYASVRMKAMENEQRIQMFRRYFGAEADKFLKQMGMPADPRLAALQTVVQNELLNQLADKLHITLSSDFIDKKLNDKGFLQKEFGLIDFEQVIDPILGINADALSYFLRSIGLTVAGFEELTLRAMKRDIINDLARSAAYVPVCEMRQKYMNDYLAKKFSIVHFDFDSFLTVAQAQGEINKKALKDFYDTENKLKKRYWVPEKRSGMAYIFAPDSYGIQIKQEEIQRYYDDNKMKLFVKEPAKVQVRRILFVVKDKENEQDVQKALNNASKTHQELLLEPSKFTQIAKEISDDKETAKDGGLLPMFSRGERDMELEKAAFFLKDDGDISNVVKTEKGYVIVQRVKRQEAQYKPLAKVTGEIKEDLLGTKFKRLFAKDVSQLLSQGAFDENKFNEFIKKAAKKEKIALQPKGDSKQSKALFRIRENIPAYYQDDKGVLVKLNQTQKRYLPALDAIKEVVTGDYQEREASQMLDKVIKKATKDAKKMEISEFKKLYGDKGKYKIKIEETGWIKPGDMQKVKELQAKGYPTERIFKLEKTGEIENFRGSEQETADGYIVKLDEVEKFNEKEYLEKQGEIKKELAKFKNMAQLEEFIAFLRKKAKIKIDR
ncbi:peptidylprolyl isomerase [Candidatus Dependentiae bacterium]